jgi:hypothetical protein
VSDETTDKKDGVFSRIVEKTRDAIATSSDEANPDIGIGRDVSRDFPDASIQPSSNDTLPSEGGIEAAPHMADDDTLVPVGPNDAGPRMTPSAAEEELEPPRTAGAFETDPRGLADGDQDRGSGKSG